VADLLEDTRIGAARWRRGPAPSWRLLLLATAVLAAGPARARDRGADGHFDRRESAHFVLWQDVDLDHRTGPLGSRRFEREVIAALEDGHAQLDRVLGLRPRRKIEVRIYDTEVFDRRFGARFGFPAAGFYGDAIHVRSRPRASASLVATLHHELVHAALDSAAPSLLLPAWLNEGLAEWFEARTAGRPALAPGDMARLRALAAAGALAPIEALAAPNLVHLDARDAGVAYLQSRALVAHLVELRGERALREVVALAIRTRDVERALERAAGLGTFALDRSLRAAFE
jgi:hypothetical protein